MPVAVAPIAYLTCELKGRDFPSRVLIASHLLAAGYPVIIGQQWAMWRNIQNAPKGCFLYKSTNMTQAEAMRRCQEAGHTVIAADEECLASSRPDIARSTHPNAIRYCDEFLALSETHRAVLIETYPEIESRISVAGNVRVDILRNARPPAPRGGTYVLINTSFGIINSIWGDVQAGAAVWINSGGHDAEAGATALIQERVAFEQASMQETRGVIDWLLANTDVDIVIRPHPQERPDMWLDIRPDRVSVVTGSDSMPWMRHALVTVHSESTTGVEAAIMGARAVNLSPPVPWSSRLIVSEVNPTVRAAREAAAMIQALMNGGAWPLPPTKATDLFPSGGTEKTVAAILRALPPPGPVGTMKWQRRERTDIERKKFSVGIDELRAALPCRAMELDDSLFYAEPARAH
jgi:surface carbohydrate biosynthesis protein